MVWIAKDLPANKPWWGVIIMVKKHLQFQSILLCLSWMRGVLWGGNFDGEFEG